MRVLKAKSGNNKIIVEINTLQYIKQMAPLQSLLDGEELQNPIEVRCYNISNQQRYGVSGVPYEEKLYSVWRGSQRVNAAKQLGYTHIEAVITNE